MGDRLQQRLTVAQMRRLQAIGRVNGDRLGRMSIDEIARVLDDPRDPALVSEVIKAGLVCLI